jgi:hypothetical protein
MAKYDSELESESIETNARGRRVRIQGLDPYRAIFEQLEGRSSDRALIMKARLRRPTTTLT